MASIGETVAHHDQIMLEQEWYYLASSNPSSSTMVKTMNNSDEAMTTRIDLFQPVEDCTFKMHLLSLPTDDKALERQRQRMLQHAQEQIEQTAFNRPIKQQIIRSTLRSQINPALLDEAVLANELKHKKSLYADQAQLVRKYRKLHANNFESLVNRTGFLKKVYGSNSPIALYKEQAELIHRIAISDGPPVVVESDQHADRSLIDKAEDEYWDNVQKVRVNTKAWVLLEDAMGGYYGHDMNKKINAACLLHSETPTRQAAVFAAVLIQRRWSC